nr:hypothetical protein BaRGS_034625 [Batillaria attramentaria]
MLWHAVTVGHWELVGTFVELVTIPDHMVSSVAKAAVAQGQWLCVFKLLQKYKHFDQSLLVASCPADKQVQSFESLKELVRSDVVKYMPVLGITLLFFVGGDAGEVDSQDAMDFLSEAIRDNLTVRWWTMMIAEGFYSHYLCLSGDHQNQILTILKKAHYTSERSVCGLLAITLAVASRSFDIVPEILSRGILQIEVAVPYVLELALKHEKWLSVGALLQRLVASPDLSWSWRESSVGVHLRSYFEFTQHIDLDRETILQPLRDVCMENGFCEATVLLSFWSGEKDKVLDFLRQNNTASMMRCVLHACVNMDGWDIALQILERQEEFPGVRRHLDNLLWYAAKSENYFFGQAQKEIVQRLIEAGSCTDPKILEGVLPVINTVELFEKLLEHDHINLAQATATGRPFFVRLACRYAQTKAREVLWLEGHLRMEEEDVYGDVQKWYRMLQMAVAAGLSTQCRGSVHPFWSKSDGFDDLMHSPAIFGNVDVLELLYNIGATSYHEIHKLKLKFEQEITSSIISGQRAQKVRECVQCLAKAPRSLRDLCRLEVSFLIGCRKDRRQRAEALGLTRLLTGYVLFHDVLS